MNKIIGYIKSLTIKKGDMVYYKGLFGKPVNAEVTSVKLKYIEVRVHTSVYKIPRFGVSRKVEDVL